MTLERCCEADIDGHEPRMTEGIRVAGPLFSGESQREHLLALRADPPERCGLSVVSLTAAVDTVSIIADCEKQEGTMRVAELFRFAGGRISELLLVFDSGGLS